MSAPLSVGFGRCVPVMRPYFFFVRRYRSMSFTECSPARWDRLQCFWNPLRNGVAAFAPQSFFFGGYGINRTSARCKKNGCNWPLSVSFCEPSFFSFQYFLFFLNTCVKHTLCNRAPAYVRDNIGETTSAMARFTRNCPNCRISRLHPFFTDLPINDLLYNR